MQKSILIVEDEAIIARSLRLCLRQYGYNVLETVSTGEDAMRSVEENNPDLILMDVRLRGSLDGYETINKIREYSNAPVIYSTGGDQYQIEEKAKGTKPYDYIMKPFDLDVLADKVKKLLDEYCDSFRKQTLQK